ncbi:MAG: ABC transporter permease [Vicinamibacteria bacterium]
MGTVRSALRHLGNAPGFTIVAILSLALGIGPTTAIFSLVDEVLLRSLPVANPDALLLLRVEHGKRGRMSRAGEGPGGVDPVTGRETGTSLSRTIFDRLRGTPAPLVAVFAFAPFSQVTLIVDGAPETSGAAQYVSGGYYAGLGVRPALGRLIEPADDAPAATPVAVISHRFWLRRFDARPDVIGATILVNRVPATVVGVSAAGFDGAQQIGETAEVSVPLSHHLLFQPDRPARAEGDYWWLRIMARLAPGATADQARAALEPAFQAAARDGWLASGRPVADRPDDPRLLVESGAQGEADARREQRRPLGLLLALAGLILAAACINVSTLLIARGSARRRTFALQLALGASRGRIIGQCLVESLLLAGAGAAAGTGLAWIGRGALRSLRPIATQAAIVLDLPIDARVLGVTIAVSMACALAFGLLPALQASRVDLASAFQGGARTLRGGGRSRLSRGLLIVQVALSLVLLISAGLFARTVASLEGLDAGFNQRGLVLFRIDATSAGYAEAGFVPLHDRIEARLAALPGVRGVTFSRVALLSRVRSNRSISLTGTAPTGPPPIVNTNGVAPNFFAMLELPVIQGRAFTDQDRQGTPKVAVVSQAFARQFFAGASPIGRRVFMGAPAYADSVEIVGVAGDAKYTDLRTEMGPTIYMPALQRIEGNADFAVRVAGDPAAALAAIRGAVREIDPSLPVLNLRTQREQVERLHGPERLFARLSTFFGLTALALVAVGLHGLLSHAVQRRTGEIGLRLAVGAEPWQMRSMIVAEAATLAAAGAAVGLLAAGLAGRYVASMLFGVTPLDPVTYGGAALLVIATAAAASLAAARRASGIDPLTALRAD